MSPQGEAAGAGGAARQLFGGWRVVAGCFVVATFGWGLGLFGASVYLRAITAAHGRAIADAASSITGFFLMSAAVQRWVGRGIDRWGPRPVLILGALPVSAGVGLLGQVSAHWQRCPVFALVGDSCWRESSTA